MSFESDGARQTAAVSLRGLGKRYEIYDRPHHRLLQTLWRGRRTYYREFWALRDVTFEVPKGQTLGIVGRNGSGKSTVLQLMAGTLAPTAGTVLARGRVAALLELGSGFNPEFTGRENAFLNGAILGIPRRDMAASMRAIERFADIGEFIDQPVKTYSSGMLVRLAFAVAVHVTPDVLIVDEALAVGDTAFQSKCLERIRAMQRSGVAIVLVSHSANAVIEFCDRAVYLDGGRMVADGEPRAVLERYSNDVVSREGGVAVRFETASEEHESAASVVLPRDPGPAPDPASQFEGVAITDAAGTPKSCFVHGDAIHITLDVLFIRANASPCFGIQLSSTDDIALWATTTAFMNRRLGPMQANTRASFTWQLRAQMGGSRYVVALGVGDNASGEYHRHARLAYAGHFDVLPQANSGSGWLEPHASFVQAESVRQPSSVG